MKHLGRNQLVERLAYQVGGSVEMAKGILIKRGHMAPSGELTAEGRRRDAMTAEERAKDRAVKQGAPSTGLTYHAKTNSVTRSGTSRVSGVKK